MLALVLAVDLDEMASRVASVRARHPALVFVVIVPFHQPRLIMRALALGAVVLCALLGVRQKLDDYGFLWWKSCGEARRMVAAGIRLPPGAADPAPSELSVSRGA